MNYAIIIQGTSGSGKTTLARSLSVANKIPCLEHDYFLFGVQLYRPETKEHFELGNQNLWSIFRNIVDNRKSFVLEGVLASYDTAINNFNLEPYLKYLKTNNYKVLRVFLSSSYDEASRRMTPREVWAAHTSHVSEDVYQKISEALSESARNADLTIDTTGLSPEEVERQVQSCIT